MGVGAEAEEDHGEHHHRGGDQHDRLPLCEPHLSNQSLIHFYKSYVTDEEIIELNMTYVDTLEIQLFFT